MGARTMACHVDVVRLANGANVNVETHVSTMDPTLIGLGTSIAHAALQTKRADYPDITRNSAPTAILASKAMRMHRDPAHCSLAIAHKCLANRSMP
jgi:hypothetical protein